METWYDVFGRRFVVRSQRRAVLERLRGNAAWSRLEAPPAPKADAEIEVLFPAEPNPLREVQSFGNETFFLHASRHKLITGHCAGRPWQVHVQSFVADPFRVAHAMVVPTLQDLVERRGLSSLHAAAVASRGRGVLLCGDTGSGKSTTALALVAQGFDFLTDNDAYLELARGAVRVRSRGTRVGLRPAAARLLPGAPALARFPLRGRGAQRKRQVDPGAMWPRACRSAATVRLLLFPRVGRGGRSRLRPLSPTEALSRLLDSYPLGGSVRGVIPDGWAQQRRFERLSQLVASAPAYALDLAPELVTLGEQVRELL